MSGSSSTPTTTTQISKVEIPSFLQPYVKRQAAISAGGLEELASRILSPANLVAPFDPAQNQAFDLATQRSGEVYPEYENYLRTVAQGRNVGDVLDPTARGALTSTAQGDYLYGGEGFNAAMDAANRQAKQAVFSTFGRSGPGGGSSGLAQAAIAQAAADSFAGLYGQERQNQLGAAGILGDYSLNFDQAEQIRRSTAAGGIPEAALAPADLLQTIGATRQGQEQRQIETPLQALANLITLAGGSTPQGALLGQTATETKPIYKNTTASTLGLALAALGLVAAPFTGGASLAATTAGFGLASGGRG